jgi:hypothetical protein
MSAERFDRELREALEPTAHEIAGLRSIALSNSPRRRSLSGRWPLAVAAVAALAAGWLATSPARRAVQPAPDTWRISNRGEVLSARHGDRVWILGSTAPRPPEAVRRRLWVSVSAE